MSIVTLPNYKLYLKIATDETSDDAELQKMVYAGEQRLKTFLNRDIEWSVYTDQLFDGNDSSILPLRQTPIIYVSAIYEWDGETWVLLVEGEDYERLVIVPGEYAIYLQDYTFGKGTQNYKITYYAGYSAGATLASGSLTVGKKYRIISRAAVDFTADGASANTVGTEFVATSATVTLTANDTVLELVSVPYDLDIVCKKIVKLEYDASPLNNNSIGYTSFSSSAGGSTETTYIDLEAEEKLLNKVRGYKCWNT